MLTNAMLNEGVPGKDTTAIAAGFEDLGASFSNGSYRDMAVAGLRSLSDADKRTQALKLFEQVIGQPTFPRTPWHASRTRSWPVSSTRSRTPASWPGWSCSSASMASIPTRTPATATKSPFHRSAANNCRRSTRKPTPPATWSSRWSATSRQEAEAIAAEVSKALPQGPALAKTAQPETPKPGLTHIDFPPSRPT